MQGTLTVPVRTLRTALDTVSDSVIVTDIHGSIVYINDSAESLTGWSATDAMHHSIDDVLLLLDPTSRTPIRSAILELSHDRAKDRFPTDYTLLPLDGRPVPVEFLLSMTDGDRHIYVFRYETSVRGQAEEEHRLRLVAEEVNHLKDRLLSMVVCELRIPLMTVMSCAEILDETARFSPVEREKLEGIRRSAALMDHLLNDLLEMGSNGCGTLSLEEIDIHTLVRRTIQDCRNDITAKELDIEIELYAEKHILRADARRLHQLLWNLLQNAVKFTPPGGRVSLHSHNAKSGRIQIEIVDTGIGIEPETLPHIFDLYRHARPAISRQYGGLRIGLAVSRAIAEAHGGTLTATSSGADRGASFILDLPTDRSIPDTYDDKTRSISAIDRSSKALRHPEAVMSARTDRTFDSVECGK